MNTREKSQILFYNKPAGDWNEALPVGNGRLGAMVFGGIAYETLQLNEDSIWSGGKRERDSLSALENLQKVRELLFEEKISEAEEIVNAAFCGTPINQRHYMPLGNLVIEAPLKDEDVTNYRRSLDLSKAVCLTEFTCKGVNYRRRVIASNPDEAILINISSDRKNSVDLKIYINDCRDDYYDFNAPVDNNTILYTGGMGGTDGIDFSSAVTVSAEGGRCERYGSFLICRSCDSVTIAVTCRTSYRHENHGELAVEDGKKALSYDFEDLTERHIADYKSYYDRCKISLGDNSGEDLLPTDKRLERIKEGKDDNLLTELYFNFGRYLLISGSRKGTLPLNLQGIWNKDMWPAWGCKFTININTEMNYWPAEVCGLGELVYPLFDLIEKMRPNGRKTAKIMYDCHGFVCHHNTDIWGDTAPQDLWTPATQWPMGAAWLCLHIWEHYLFTKDRRFLSEKFETIKEAALFFTEFLVENKKGELVTCPSVSPENVYITKIGTKGSVCAGPSMDSQIIYELFSAVIESGKILGRDKEFCDKLEQMRDRLPKPQIGKYGQIMEWAEDYDEAEPGHRHISQLFALYPGDMITKRKTPVLADAAKATLERRLSHGGGHTGWSRAWIINHWARLFDGEKVYENIASLLSHSTSINMFDMHPPFQIDGNFGGTAGIAEALLQSCAGEIIILPALPEKWSEGSFENLRARGGFEVSVKWESLKAKEVMITSLCGSQCRLVLDGVKKITCGGNETPFEFIDGGVSFDTIKGETYTVLV